MKQSIIFLIVTFTTIQSFSQNYEKLRKYLDSNWKTPEEYVISKFNDHDYVFIGEYHRIKHDVDLILNLIPLLYENEIYNLAIEFGAYNIQEVIDSIITAPVFDRKLLKSIYFKNNPVWGYKEYIDIYEVAWKVNKENPNSSLKFRVVNLAPPYDPCKEGGAWNNLDPDVYMANVLKKEIISQNQKALIYSGNLHAFTKYHQPLYDFERDTLYGYTKTRMGNIIHDSLNVKTFNINLHAGWISDNGWNAQRVLPVNGAIDSIMNMYSDKRVGFDVVNSPFGKLNSTDSYYALGYDNFTLDKYCDGYIYQFAFKDYQPITSEPEFYTSKNIHALRKYLRCIGWTEIAVLTTFKFNASKRTYENIRNHFKHLMK
ncbi:hypothetical protein [Tenuifilum osseticum]|uniref:hypothetical protein n=1 Tax=Tenuifilum osseticum TaxID=3374723 RepID=UPI0034E47477